ncbi:Uncharacterized protein FKW44_012650 [Caligus rogercresseyi]|uniref:Uncharacterized protein n=1 Tax=Caligus rogercresseyi TaxID=217165 RepID=A0A7T8KAH0_CALRO|nr:Uncharacterized protein FKW44_012650 [Caligus rogercresseyi]
MGRVYWRMMKKRFVQMNGTNSSMLPSHLDEFMWREAYGKTPEEAFNNILLHLSSWFRVNE